MPKRSNRFKLGKGLGRRLGKPTGPVGGPGGAGCGTVSIALSLAFIVLFIILIVFAANNRNTWFGGEREPPQGTTSDSAYLTDEPEPPDRPQNDAARWVAVWVVVGAGALGSAGYIFWRKMKEKD